MSQHEALKKDWNHKMPYPVWPFGAVNPRELARWAKANAPKPDAAPF